MFVKYGGTEDIMAEADTQSFFYALSKRDPSAPGVPAVLNAFRAEGYYFLVTEKIDKPSLAECSVIQEEAVKLVADAAGQMPSVPASVFSRIPTTKARVWHPFFKEYQPPISFASTDAVNKYVDTVQILPLAAFTVSVICDFILPWKAQWCHFLQ